MIEHLFEKNEKHLFNKISIYPLSTEERGTSL